MCYGGCRNDAEGARGGGLKSADCRPANWRPVIARGSPVRGLLTSMPQIVVGDPEPTPQRQKLPLPMQQSPGARLVRDSDDQEMDKGKDWAKSPTEELSWDLDPKSRDYTEYSC